jgi:hypothetical protein
VRYGEIRGNEEDFEEFENVAWSEPEKKVPRRIDLEPEKIERGFAQLVLSLIELIRQLVEKQALRRVEAGGLAPEQVERLGTALMRLEQKMQELKVYFEIENLNIDLGSLGNLID